MTAQPGGRRVGLQNDRDRRGRGALSIYALCSLDSPTSSAPRSPDFPGPQSTPNATRCLPGFVRSLQDLAKRDGITRRYIRRLVGLAFLSPDLVETILQGRQPVELSATRLTALDLPLDWVEQRRLLAS